MSTLDANRLGILSSSYFHNHHASSAVSAPQRRARQGSTVMKLGVVAAKIRTLAARGRALASAAASSSKQSLLAATLAAAGAAAALLQDQYRVRRHAPDLRRYDALFTVEPLSFLWSYSLRLRCWLEFTPPSSARTKGDICRPQE